MDVNSATQAQNGTARPTGALTDSKSLAETFDNFLLLLTTQLQNQDPLDPLESNEFTQQLVQFSGVEQQIKTNDRLDLLISGQAFNEAAQAVGFLGKIVEAEGNQVDLSGGAAPIVYDLESEAAKVEILLTNSAGQTVRTLDGTKAAGRNELVWDGLDDYGNPLPEGAYTIQVRATTAEDKTVGATTYTLGKVTGVETVDGVLQLMVGNAPIRLDSIRSFREPVTTTS